jgi:hypothetical protein
MIYNSGFEISQRSRGKHYEETKKTTVDNNKQTIVGGLHLENDYQESE